MDDFTDVDGDGFDDALSGTPTALPDTDGDGISDVEDSDATAIVTPQSGAVGEVITGLSGTGFGCTVGNTRADPFLPVLLLLAMCGLLYSRRAH